MIFFNAKQFCFNSSINQLNNKVVVIRTPFGICIKERQIKRIHIVWAYKNRRKQCCSISTGPRIANYCIYRTAMRCTQSIIITVTSTHCPFCSTSHNACCPTISYKTSTLEILTPRICINHNRNFFEIKRYIIKQKTVAIFWNTDKSYLESFG